MNFYQDLSCIVDIFESMKLQNSENAFPIMNFTINKNDQNEVQF